MHLDAILQFSSIKFMRIVEYLKVTNFLYFLKRLCRIDFYLLKSYLIARHSRLS